MPRDVFISHVEQDRAVAEAVCAALEQAGHLCATAAEGSDDARLVLAILSAQSAGSPEIAREAHQAARLGTPVILLRIDPVEPAPALASALIGAQRVDALSPPLQPHLDYLAAIAGRLLDGEETGRPLTAPPRPLPPRPVTRAWLPVALAGAAGLAAIAAVAAWRG